VTIYGWDCSDYDWPRGPMNLVAAKDAGISFFTHKATEGATGTHVHYGEALRRARDAGIPVLGAYHVVRSGDVAAEVRHFLAHLDQETPWWRTWPDWILQADIEKWSYDSVSPATALAFVAELAAAVPERSPVAYASKGQYGDDLSPLSASVPLWNANYPSRNPGSFVGLYARAGGDGGPGWAKYSGRVPAVWQYTDNATIGSQPGCDANAYKGTLDQLKALLRGPAHAQGVDDMALTDKVPGSKTPDHTDDRTVAEILGDAAKERAVLQGVLTPADGGFKAGSPLDQFVATPARLTALEKAVADMMTALGRIEAAQQGGNGGAPTGDVTVSGTLHLG